MRARTLVLIASVIGCGSSDHGADAGADAHPGGQMHLSWAVTVGGTASTCADAGIAFISLRAEPDGGGASVTTQWPCDEYHGSTTILDIGTYRAIISSLDESGATIDAFPPEIGISVEEGRTSELGTFTFAY